MGAETFAFAGAGRLMGRRLEILLVALAVGTVGLALCASSAFALAPSVGSKGASNVAESTATLNGTVNPNGLETKTYFEYGPTVAYGSKTAEVSVGSGSSALETAKAVSGLTPNTTYHYRVVATNADGTSTGGDRTFHVGWKVQAPAAISGIGVFEDVSCSSATACTAVGWAGSQAIAQRWDGVEWKAQTPAKPAGSTEAVLKGVSCTSSTACTAVGRYKNSSAKWVTLVEAWDGSEWKVQPSPNPSSTLAELEDVSCSSANDCTAVGVYWNSGPPETGQTLAIRWDGTEWKIQATLNPTPSNSAYLTSVSCPASTFCMATGFYYDSANFKWVPLSEIWDGTAWALKTAVQPAGSTMSWFYGVSCTSATACTAVGDKEINAGTHQHQTMAQRWNGTSWSLQTTPNPEGTNLEFSDVSCTSSVFCTGTGHAVSGGISTPMALRWDGSAWALQMLPLPSGATGANTYSNGISCIPSRGCQMVGQYTNASSVIVPLAEASWRSATPTVTTTAATSVGEKTATVNATVNPNGSETKGYFEYGTTTSYGSKTAEANLGSGSSAVEVSAALSGLAPATTYHYRIVANNENPETSRGTDLTFKTAGPPTVSTLAAEVDGGGEAATLRGQVNPNGLNTTYQFEYGTSPGFYTNTVPAVAESAGSGTESKLVSYEVTGLTPGKQYYYRVTATNSAGKSNGGPVEFTTPGPPLATTGSAAEVTRKCATLQGVVWPNGQISKYWFEYGTSTSYGTKIPVTPKETTGASGSQPVKETVCGLKPITLYHFRLVAENSLGTGNGVDKTVTTLPTVTLRAKKVPLSLGTPLKGVGSNLKFTSDTSAVHTCQEVEVGGAVTENPGAMQSITALKIQNSGGAGCPYSGLTIKYSSPGEGKALEYAFNEGGNRIVRTGPFTLVGTVYLGMFKAGECEYNAELNGTIFGTESTEIMLTGKLVTVKATPSGTPCFASETISGSLAVTSSGTPVEVTG